MESDSSNRAKLITAVLLFGLLLAVIWPLGRRGNRQPDWKHVDTGTNAVRVFLNGLPLEPDNLFIVPKTNRLELRAILENWTTNAIDALWISFQVMNTITNLLEPGPWQAPPERNGTETQFFPVPANVRVEAGKTRRVQPFVFDTASLEALGFFVVVGAGPDVGPKSRVHFFFGPEEATKALTGENAEKLLKARMGAGYNERATLISKEQR